MTPITWQAAVDDEEQRPLPQDILKAAVDDWRLTNVARGKTFHHTELVVQ